MPFLDPLHPVQSALIETLANNKPMKVAHILKVFQEKYQIEISQASLYRTISQLLDKQVLVKHKDTLTLNFVWVSSVINFASLLKKQYFNDNREFVNLHLEQGERKIFYANSLNDIDAIWNHLQMQILKTSHEDYWYKYLSHPYYQLGMLTTEIKLLKTIIENHVDVRVVFGNKTFLDKYGRDSVTLAGYFPKISENMPFLKEGYICDVYGDYIIECLYPEFLAQRFASFFNTVTNIEDFYPKKFMDLFYMKMNCQLLVIRDKQRADGMKKTLGSVYSR